MSDTPALPEPIGWRYVPSDVWRDYVLTDNREKACIARDYGRTVEPLFTAAQLRAALAAQAEKHAAEIERYKSTMIAAAEEIHAHWQAHCDAEGYGPQNLQRRLEEGIPSEYGYTAGAFERLRAERDALRADAERWRYFVTHCEWIRHWPQDAERDEPYSYMLVRLPYGADQSCVATRNAAIDAARAQGGTP